MLESSQTTRDRKNNNQLKTVFLVHSRPRRFEQALRGAADEGGGLPAQQWSGASRHQGLLTIWGRIVVWREGREGGRGGFLRNNGVAHGNIKVC